MAVYDIDTLRRGLVSIEANIVEIEAALKRERERKAEYEREIVRAEAILEMHKGARKDGGSSGRDS